MPYITGILQNSSGSWRVAIPTKVQLPSKIPDSKHLSRPGGFEQSLLSLGLPGFLALSFLGGLILNIMPCVLPVLSLKVFSLLKHSGQTRGEALRHGVVYTAGVVLSFLLLATALFLLRTIVPKRKLYRPQRMQKSMRILANSLKGMPPLLENVGSP